MIQMTWVERKKNIATYENSDVVSSQQPWIKKLDW
jgi:hypothetical protein